MCEIDAIGQVRELRVVEGIGLSIGVRPPRPEAHVLGGLAIGVMRRERPAARTHLVVDQLGERGP
jgi:hypothetical protein